VDALRAHKERQAAERLAAGSQWNDHDLVFATRTGGALDAANVRREFKAACRAARIGEHWTPRELRHSFVSLMSSSGVPVEEIARLAGHSDHSNQLAFAVTMVTPIMCIVIGPARRISISPT
jgi:site-specific recombinase XerD